jgi:hypothetical protein
MALTAIRIPEWVHEQAVLFSASTETNGFILVVCIAQET